MANAHPRAKAKLAHSWVVKIGSSLLADINSGLNLNAIASFAAEIAAVKKCGINIVLVSSGSIAVGMQCLGWRQRPRAIHKLQAAAAVGQMGLVQAYESAFKRYGLHTAQILLSNADLSNRARYLNARSALRTLLNLNIVPVVNENDTVATDEIRFGDNDTLAALVANLVEAKYLVLLTDQDGLYDADPRCNPNATLIKQAQASDVSLERFVGSVGALGRGGMLTKLRAAEKAARSGTDTIIVAGSNPTALSDLAAGNKPGTWLTAGNGRLVARKQWLAGQLRVKGTLVLDAGAVKMVQQFGKSLLAAGVKRADGNFARGELVACVSEQDQEVARGLVNYNATEVAKIAGHSSQRIEQILGYVDEPELIDRDNMVVIKAD